MAFSGGSAKIAGKKRSPGAILELGTGGSEEAVTGKSSDALESSRRWCRIDWRAAKSKWERDWVYISTLEVRKGICFEMRFVGSYMCECVKGM